jgi:predicted membrane channel-forming protein YqfA (hemolysin III family)
VTVKSTIGVVVLVFVVFYIMTSPDQAANIFHTTWHAIVNVAHGVAKFFDKLAS